MHDRGAERHTPACMQVWGNVWQTPCIARIDPQDAAVAGWIILEGLEQRAAAANRALRLPMDVLNGIAYDAARGRVFVTGKLWASMFEIRIVEVPDEQQTPQRQHARTLCRPRAHPL
jgi:glutaminyl-peptide cyclotransferase